MIVIRPVVSPAEWERRRAAQAGATPFHCWGWLQVMAQSLGMRFVPLGFYQSDQLVGLAPLLVKQRGPFTNVNWAPFPYLGPLVAGDLLADALRALDAYQRRNRLGLIQLGFAPAADVEERTLVAAGYAVHTDTTMILPLAGRGEADLLAGVTSHGRKNLKRAQKGGVTVAPSTEHEIKSVLFEIMAEVFTQQGERPHYPASAAALMWDRYHDDPDVRMATAYCEGEPAAISITVADGERALFWQGGSRPRFRNVNPNAAVYWDAILWARERGYRELDMVGNPNPGIAYYKSTFGAVETPYLVARRQNSRLTGLAFQAYNRVTKVLHAGAPWPHRRRKESARVSSGT